MDLCDEIYKNLQLLKDDKLIKSDELRILINLVCKQLNNEDKKRNDELSAKFNKLDYNHKKLFISIYYIYLELSRLNTNLETELKELKLMIDNIDMLEANKNLIIDSYKQLNENEFRTNLIQKLSTLNLDCKQQFIDQIKTIELTKDSVVKSSRKTDYRHIGQTEYLMNIETEHTKHLFTCSIQNIEEMSNKFKEIMKTIDKLFNQKKV